VRAGGSALLGLFFEPEDGGDMFLQNIDWLSVDYAALYIPEDGTLHNHCYENLKSYFIYSDLHNRMQQNLSDEEIRNRPVLIEHM
jgi:hypothetical protein